MGGLFPPNGVKPLTVSELTGEVKNALAERFPQGVWVSGEISNLARPSSGHVYCKLKDAGSQLNTVIYRGVSLRLRFDLQDGMEVIARGRLIVYVPRGEYQLQVEEIQPKGIGPLELAFRQLKEKLSVKGYFEPRRKRTLPLFPRRVVLVTSPSGSAVRDMIETLTSRWPAVEIWVRPVPVQGEGAGAKIAEAIDALNLIQGIDVLIVGRGGGSLEDLWPFNEECVADAIYRSRLPIVSGVGHEDDLTICDMVADVRGLTPTDAAVKVTPMSLVEVVGMLDSATGRMKAALLGRLERAGEKLASLAQRRCFRQPLERVQEGAQSVDELGDRLKRGIKARLQQAGERLGSMAARLETLSPLNVLGRGYSLTRKAGETTVLCDAEQVKSGDVLVTRLRRGQVTSRAERVEAGSDSRTNE